MVASQLQIARTAEPDRSWWDEATAQAAQLLRSGFLPSEIQRPEQAVAIMLKGHELGLPRMYSLANIAIVKGKPTISAEALLTLVHRDYGQHAMRVSETDDKHCTIEWRQPGWDGISRYTYTWAMAQRAGLVGAGTWQKHPEAMLRARAISAAVRMAFPECGAGLYIPGELGEAVNVTDEGVVISAARPEAGTSWTFEPNDEPAPAPVEPGPEEKQERADAMQYLHFVGITKGLANDADDDALHTQVHNAAYFLHPPSSGDRGMTLEQLTTLGMAGISLGDYSAQALRDLAAEIETADDEDLSLWVRDWFAEIKVATPAMLTDIGTFFAEHGVTSQSHPTFAKAWALRSAQLTRLNRRAA